MHGSLSSAVKARQIRSMSRNLVRRTGWNLARRLLSLVVLDGKVYLDVWMMAPARQAPKEG